MKIKLKNSEKIIYNRIKQEELIMIKVAELVNNKIICGDVDTNGFWEHIFVIYGIQVQQGRVDFNLNPLLMFGDFDQCIKINENNVLYMYNSDDSFKQTYLQQITKIKVQRSGLILP